jgi:23S rRNA (adenine2503-C2)-methyltransferase
MGLEIGLAISATKVTISTAGLVPMIYRLAQDLPKAGLAISLNATTDEVRDRLMPINRRYPIGELMKAAEHVARAAQRRWVTFEYALIAGVNDSDADARRLASLASSFPCKINLIPFNLVPGRSYARPPQERIDRFHRILWDKNLTVTVRWSKGDDIAAACGQLQATVPGPQAGLVEPPDGEVERRGEACPRQVGQQKDARGMAAAPERAGGEKDEKPQPNDVDERGADVPQAEE